MITRKKTGLPIWALMIGLILLFPVRSLTETADSPVAWFKMDWHRALRIRSDPGLQTPETADTQKRQVWALLDASFDGDLVVPRILARTWPALTPEERDRLLPAMAWGIKWKLVGKLYKYNVKSVHFEKGKVDSGAYLLDAVFSAGKIDHPATFVFVKTSERWDAVDIRIRGMSLTGHYRRKFDGTYFKKGIEGLLSQLDKEVNEEFEEMGYRPLETPR